MALRILSGGAIAALAGAAMLAASNGASDAFTLSSPSLEPPVASAGVEQAWWHNGWGWHRGWGWHGGWHRWGWGPYNYRPWGWRGYGYGYGVRRCWIGRWGYRHCAWW
jgi:hypothetical protein